MNHYLGDFYFPGENLFSLIKEIKDFLHSVDTEMVSVKPNLILPNFFGNIDDYPPEDFDFNPSTESYYFEYDSQGVESFEESKREKKMKRIQLLRKFLRLVDKGYFRGIPEDEDDSYLFSSSDEEYEMEKKKNEFHLEKRKKNRKNRSKNPKVLLKKNFKCDDDIL